MRTESWYASPPPRSPSCPQIALASPILILLHCCPKQLYCQLTCSSRLSRSYDAWATSCAGGSGVASRGWSAPEANPGGSATKLALPHRHRDMWCGGGSWVRTVPLKSSENPCIHLSSCLVRRHLWLHPFLLLWRLDKKLQGWRKKYSSQNETLPLLQLSPLHVHGTWRQEDRITIVMSLYCIMSQHRNPGHRAPWWQWWSYHYEGGDKCPELCTGGAGEGWWQGSLPLTEASYGNGVSSISSPLPRTAPKWSLAGGGAGWCKGQEAYGGGSASCSLPRDSPLAGSATAWWHYSLLALDHVSIGCGFCATAGSPGKNWA